jgi:prepilin-type N-terminal cleavage/methylation domain-containing protein
MTKDRIQNAEYRGKIRGARRCGMTLIEIIISLAIITIILAVIVPQFVMMRSNWTSKKSATEVLQNGRILMDHLERNISQAVSITAVSSSSTTNGYIQFVDDDGNNFRYDINSTSNYVEYGAPGNLSDLAGPVSQLQFSCYDACNLDTPLSSPIDTNSIRFVKAGAILTNSSSFGQNKTLIASSYLRIHASGLVVWWKFDETSGLTAADSSGSGNNGTLTNMVGNEWTTGQINGALAFNGNKEFVTVANLSNQLGTNYTVSWWAEPNQLAVAENIVLGTDSTNHDFDYYQNGANLCIRAHNSSNNDITVSNVFFVGQWVNICVVGDSNGTRVYIDGNSIPAGTTSVTKSTTSGYSLNVGAYPTGTNSFNGTIDDVRVYNRALSTTEITALANILNYMFPPSPAKAGTDTTSVIIPTPATNAGDLLIAAVATDSDTSGSMAAPAGQGWTLINRGGYNSDVALGAWWKSAGASEPANYTFTWTGNHQAYGWMMRFTGHNPTSPINTFATNGQTSSTPTSPAVTTTVNECLILRLGAFDDDNEIVVGQPGLPGCTPITMDGTGVWYQGFSDNNLPGGGTSLPILKPNGTNQGDLLVAAVVVYGNAAITATGWTTQIYQGTSNGNTVRLGVWCKQAGASEPASYSFTWSGNRQAYGWIMRFTGQNTTTPINGTAQTWSGSSQIPTSPSVTTTVPNAMIIRVGAFAGNTIKVGSPGLPFHTAITMNESGTSGNTCSGGAGYKKQLVAGASGTSNFSLTASQSSRTVTFAIAPLGSNGTVSGGAGYVKLPAAGNSGTSTFNIGSSAYPAQTLTIAIAPGNGGEQILP